MSYYIGIDQSFTSSGLVILDKEYSVVSYEIISTLKSDGDYFQRAKIVSESVAYKIQSFSETVGTRPSIGLEGLAFGMRGSTLQNLAGLQFMLINAIRENGFSVSIHTPSRIKKFATGRGKAGKEDMFLAMPDKTKKMFGAVNKTNGRYDLADAYWIARLQWNQDTGTLDL